MVNNRKSLSIQEKKGYISTYTQKRLGKLLFNDYGTVKRGCIKTYITDSYACKRGVSVMALV